MRNIVVTGGSGKAGQACVTGLCNAGFAVTDVDVAASGDPDAPTLIADLTDLGQTVEALNGADAVVHLAAVPAPNILPDSETFGNNTLSTYNVFSAANILKINKVVWASSETLIGLPFQRQKPAYAPIDEDHPRLPEFHYALSKLVGEVMAEQFTRWHGTTIIGLRISNIMESHDYERFPSWQDDPSVRAWNLWGYVDTRDVAQAARLALASDRSDNYLIAAADTCMTRSSADLMAEVYPDVPMKRPVSGTETLLSIDKARQVLSYQPEHSWRNYAG